MNRKIGLLGATSAAALLLAAPGHAQIGNPQGVPMPQTPSDQSVNPVAPPNDVQESPVEDGEIVVTGLRRSLESAQAIKRNSDGIVDAVVAEDIGKLPDTFASSALARVSGVNVTRGGGESAGVTVRGLPDLSTTYNGREIFTAEGRFVAIQDFPAGTVAALEVYKSSTANLIEGGIGGQVNVRGRRPFDFQGFEISGSVNGVNWEQAGTLGWNGNLLVSGRWDTGIGEMGLLVNGSYVDIDFLDATREQATVIGTTAAAQGVQAGVRYPDGQAIFHGRGDRFRPSVNAAFQWRPTPELEVYLDGLFQGFRSKDANRFMFVPIFGDLRLSNLVTRTDNPTQAESFTVAGAARPDGWFGSGRGHTDTYQAGGGVVWKRDNLQISGDVAYTDSRFTFDLLNIDHAFASSPVRNVAFNVGEDGGPSFNFVNFDVTDPANYITRGFFQELVDVGGKDIQTRFDVRYDLGTGLLRRIEFGARYNDRDANRDRGTLYINNEGSRVPLSNLPVRLTSTTPGFSFNDDFPIRTFVAAPFDSIRDNADPLRAFFGVGTPEFNPTENFRANEKALAAYGQIKYGVDIGDTMVIDGVVGIRAIRTKTSIDGFTRVENTGAEPVFTPVAQSNEYTDYLPNVSARIAFNPEIQLRLAYTQTRTRPNFFDLNPTQTVGNPPSPPPECTDTPTLPQCQSDRLRRGVSGGNPDLNPLTSDNYDASLEWYFSRAGSLTAAIFRRDANGFIFRNSVPAVDPAYGNIQLDLPFNSGNTRFQGAEVAFTSFLDFEGLPTWARAFGIQANGTYVDSEGDRQPEFNRLLNNRRVPFNGVSKWSYNLVALYERPVFSARLAYNYRSRFVSYYSTEPFDVGPSLSGSGVIEPRVRGVFERGRGQLDFSTTVTPVPNITLAFDIINLLGNPLQRDRQYNDEGDVFDRQIIYLERVYSLGVRFRF